jgi:hypothetical protein
MPFDGTNNETVEILLKIRDEIVAGHWCKKAQYDDRGNRCIIGWWHYFHKQATWDTEGEFFDLFGRSIVAFNDAPNTTEDDMAAAIDGAIARSIGRS